MPKDFVSISDIDKSILLDIRYHGIHNFVGSHIDGYEASKCLLTKKAALALKKVQQEANAFGLTLKVYDCYRPQTGVNHFVKWAKDLKDTKMKGEFYPRVKKPALFKDGYIASKSGHSRGSTLDLTLVELPVRNQPPFNPKRRLQSCLNPANERFADNSIDMGTGYDCFDPLSHTDNPRISSNARQNRLLLRLLMEKHGFENYPNEWWHFTLKNEPHPKTFFDFAVK